MLSEYARILEYLVEHKLVLVLGGDLPKNITGLPSRLDLAHTLAHKYKLTDVSSLAGVAQHLTPHQFIDFLLQELTSQPVTPGPFHRRLAQLIQKHQIDVIITTTYDDLLERALADAGIPINCLIRGSNAAFKRPERPTLIKLYGDIQQVDTLIVTEDDHLGIWHNQDKANLLAEIKVALQSKASLVLGYNLTDPDFKLLWDDMRRRMGRFSIGAFAAWPGLTASTIRIWEQRQVRALDVEPLGLLDVLLSPETVFPALPQNKKASPQDPPDSSPPDGLDTVPQGKVLVERKGIRTKIELWLSQMNKEDYIQVRINLSARLRQHYNLSELEDMCFALGIDYQDLRGSNKVDKIRELILHMERRSQLADLIDYLQRDGRMDDLFQHLQ